jgi:hypothetical protein
VAHASVPREGWTIADAMAMLASNRLTGRRWQLAFLRWQQAVSCREEVPERVEDNLLRFWQEPERDLHGRLASGEAYLIGYREGESQHTRPDREWCSIATLHPLDDCAETTALKLRDVRIFLDASTSSPPEAKPRPRSKRADPQYRKWTSDLGRYPTKLEAEQWARDAGYQMSVGRALHREGRARGVGRPKKPLGSKNGQK